MPCEDPAEVLESDKAAAEAASDATKDIVEDLVGTTIEGLGANGKAWQKVFDLVTKGAEVASDAAGEEASGEGGTHKMGYASFGDHEIALGEKLSTYAKAIEAIGAVAAFIPPAEPIAIVAEGAGLSLDLMGTALKSLGAAYNDLNPGRNPECDPPSTFPIGPFTDPPISPLVIDLDGDGVELTTLAGSTVHFDFGATGFSQRTAWVRPDDGILVYDANSNGKIDNGHEMFGNQNSNGFDVLAYYDGRTGGNYYTDNAGGTVDPTHHDGVIDADDPIFADLRVWKDFNQNGVADSGELLSLNDAGIVSINLGYSAVSQTISGNAVHQASTVTMSGSVTRDVADVWFNVDRTNTVAAGDENSADAALPDLHGYGMVKSLHLAMADDRDLAADVNAFVHDAPGMSTSALISQFQDLLYKWADVEGAPARGDYVDGRMLAFLEKAHDGAFEQFLGYNANTGNPGPNAGAALTSAFNAASETLLVKFLSQLTGYNLATYDGGADFHATKFDVLFTSLSYNPATDGLFFDGDAFARGFADLDMSDASAVQAARDVFDLLPFIQNALNVSAADFATKMSGAFTDEGATQVTSLLDEVSFDSNSAYATTSNGKADFSDLPGSYVVVAPNAEIAADPEHNNIYFIGRDLGVVTVAADSGVDRLLFAQSFDGATKTVSFDPDTGDVTLEFTDLGTTVVLAGYFAPGQVFDGFHYQAITGDLLGQEVIGDELRFHDGEGLVASDLAASLVPGPTSGADAIEGTPVSDLLSGGAGDDTIVGGHGNDTIQGGTGNDVLGSDEGFGAAANGGRDIYVIEVGDGHDTINDDNNGGLYNTLRLEGTDPDDVVLSQDGDDVLISFTGRAGDSVRLNGQLSHETISTIHFDGDVTWDAAKIRTNLVLGQASAGDDTLNGLSDAETLAGGHGNDLIVGSSDHFGAGDTFLYSAGDGDDTISANYGASLDTLKLLDLTATNVTVSRSGDDAILTFSSPAGGSVTLHDQFAHNSLTVLERVVFSNGEVWSDSDLTYLSTTRATSAATVGDSGNNSISGTSGVDALAGAGGNDTLAGGAGGDDYFFASGDGHDVIDDQGRVATEEVDVLHLDVDPEDVALSRDGYDVVVTLVDTGDTVRLKSFFSIIDQQNQHSDYSVDLIKFADGTVWNGDDIVAAAWLRGTGSADSITGTRDGDVIVGGAGDDTLAGYRGEDTYRTASGDGDDLIVEQSGDGDGGRILFTDANFADLKVELSIVDDTQWIKLVRLDDTGSVRFAYGPGVDSVEFADHAVMTQAQLLGAGVFEGTSGADEIHGRGQDRIHGGQGADTLYGAGEDTFQWARYDGADVLHTGGHGLLNDVLALTDVTPGFVHLARVPTADDFNGQLYDLQVIVEPLQATDVAETITVTGQYYDDPTKVGGVGRITFGDGSQWTAADIARLAPVQGSSSAESLLGSKYGESLSGGAGDDTLTGGRGDDTYVWAKGDGDDVIVEAPDGAVNTLKFTDVNPDGVTLAVDGEDVLVSVTATSEVIKLQRQALGDGSGVQRFVFGNGVTWSLDDIQAHISLHGTSGDDYLSGTPLADNLYGEAGNDGLDGGDGKDHLIGGQGDDALYGGDGADTYVYASGDGNDTIQDNQSSAGVQVDTLQLTDINQADVSLAIVGSDVVLTVTATGETITVSGQYANAIFGDGYGQASDGIERIVFADGELSRAGIDSATGFVPVNHVIEGTSGADTLSGDYGPNHISGLGGADQIDAGGMNDTLNGGAGDDTLASGTGDDLIIAEAGDGNDHIDGGDGIDTLDLSAMSSAVTVDLSLGTASGTEIGSDTVQSVEVVIGGSGNDTLTGSSGADQHYGNDGDDSLQGKGGDDYLEGDGGADTLNGGTGDDQIDGGDGADTYVFNSGDGADEITDHGADTDTDILQFGAGIGVGDLTILRPDPGSATIVITVGSSGDQITLDNELDTFGSGVESIVFDGGPTWSKSDLRGFVISQQITSDSDEIYGTPAADSINGGGGDDFVFGADGNDTLLGGQGADTLDGGFGDNNLTGGAGADVFDLRFPFGANTVTDFNATDGDVVRVGSGYTFASLQPHAHQDGADIVIQLDYGNPLRIVGASLSSMQASWFSFT